MAKVNDDQMLLGASLVGDIYRNMAQELFIRMIKRIKKRGVADLKDNPYLWQLEKLNDMHMLNEENIKYVSKQTGVARELLDEIIQNEGLAVYQNTAEQLANDLNIATPAYNSVQETLAQYAGQTFLDIDNLVNQTLLTTNLGNNSTMRVYKSIIEQSVAEVTTGLKSPDKALSDTVMKWLNKGIPSAFTDKGGNTWSIERYADTVMRSTTYRVYNEMRTSASEQMGVDTFLMSSHAASRPACAPIQGHIVTKKESGFESHDSDIGYVESLYNHGWGEPGGTLGINCHHTLTPFVIGVNSLPDVDIPDPSKAIANGKKQASQRSYERGIRDAKYKLEAAKQLGDEKLTQRYKTLLSNRQLGLRNLIDDNEFLHRDYSRERIYKNQKLIDVYKTKQQRDISKAYNKVSETLGKHAPSKEDYRNIRKNSRKYRDLSKDVKTVNYIKNSSRETSDEGIRHKGVDIYYSLKRDGYEVSGHAATRMADRMTRKNGTLNYNYQTIVNTMAKMPNYIDKRNNRKVRYYGKIGVVTENDDKIVTFIKQKKPSRNWRRL